jgi:hypothetical protein
MSNIGRFFYRTAIAGIGLLMIYYQDFPYMLFLIQPWLIPPETLIKNIPEHH